MSQQIKCPAKEPMHHAGVNQAGIRKHIYSCKALKRKDADTIVYQCQYCQIHFYLSKQDLEQHVKLCSLSYPKKIEWNERINTIIIPADPHLKIIDPKEACKNWEYYRDRNKKMKEMKRLSVQPSSNTSLNSQNDDSNRSQSPCKINSPSKIKKLKPSESQQCYPTQELSQEEILRQEQLMKENDEKIRVQYLEELKNRIKVDDYQDNLYTN
ncbi:hypothetical protein TTHERM_00474360 (macronuclear) [Tetrahymena thermophila SB210]|uniref:Uncharacterized protein n=1 Tax=Tetrahymena thermophila (strain SB210) TaxID=312017 RepID=I7LX33_TETTS|nr:hypothetical protein TTHERM_00474360 [Tetrahymena thermophila SB210]EAS03675.1 hypothetical protein TTHERM_00474360 [Tetrahymena thermophila SB210]|eukprot:XP_001023920.1 hypothetical protein TTHERM_00474360 [Tetrahymena thermophila SB210]